MQRSATSRWSWVLIAALACAVAGCGDTDSATGSGSDTTSSFDGQAVDAKLTTGCPPGFAGCQAGERWVCNDQGSGFQKQPCSAGLSCSEGACVECAPELPCKDGKTCSAGKCQMAPLEILTKNLPTALAGQPYKTQLQVKGGVAPYAWKLSQGALPAGIVLSDAGELSGTATAPGSFSFLVEVSDAAKTSQGQILALEVKAGGLVIATPSPLPTATEGESYATTLTAQGGESPYYWGIAAGKLPTGLQLSADGSIAGTPQTDAAATFTVKVFDNAAAPLTTTKEFTLPIKLAPLEIVGAQQINLIITKIIVLPLIIVVDKVPVPYNAKLEAKGGKKPYVWKETPLPGAVKNFLPKSGIPQGLKLASDGTISGSVTDTSLVFEFKVPLSQITLKGFFFAAEVADSQSQPQTKTALFIIPTVPVGGN